MMRGRNKEEIERRKGQRELEQMLKGLLKDLCW